jgi:hypothetical protein
VVLPCILTCNLTRKPPNQVSYLKRSSIESFILGLTPKIDFRSAQQHHTQQWLQRDLLSTITLQFNSLSTKEFNTEFLQFSSGWLIRCTQFPARASGPWRLASGRLDFECDTCLMDKSVRTRIHIVRTVAAIFPYLCFGRKSHSWSNTECRPDVLLKRLDGCKLEQFEASRHKGRSGRNVPVVRTDDALDSWAFGRYITSSGGLQGIRFF